MGEAKATEKAPKKSWFAGLQAEFKKIIWPDKASITRQTVAVTIISVFLGALIKILDMIIQLGLNLIA
ncbi:preprotein translocase subunit SecE [Lachnospiraceae bacterium HCP1S3_C3]|nr:preprotein translocase subunit SecE [Lachnospiraceae bacterium]MDD6856771.1 preprotein translocase subunit SecE [Lachnospiraceae bacterium]